MKAIRRSPYQALVAVLMMSLSFFVASCFLFVLFIANKALQYIETRPQVIGYFEIKATDDQIAAAKTAMQQKEYVAGVKVVTKQEALKIFQEENKKDPLLSELVTADILPASLEVSAKEAQELEKISTDVKALSGIEEVVYQKDLITKLTRWSLLLRQSGVTITAILFSITLLLVFVILSLRVSSKRKEIGIMNLLGASRWYIRGPYVLEGVLYGISGAFFGWLLSFIVLLYATPMIVGFFGSIPVLPMPPIFLLSLLGGSVGVGLLLGLFSSFLAVSRYIKQ
jgi:cell division transport system permease protein